MVTSLQPLSITVNPLKWREQALYGVGKPGTRTIYVKNLDKNEKIVSLTDKTFVANGTTRIGKNSTANRIVPNLRERINSCTFDACSLRTTCVTIAHDADSNVGHLKKFLLAVIAICSIVSTVMTVMGINYSLEETLPQKQ